MILSASKIKTLEHCSWIFNAKYIDKVPDKTNKGAQIGTLVHLVLECLLNKRHRKHFDYIVKNNSILKNKPVLKLVKKHLKNLSLEDSLGDVNDLILVALNFDFFIEGFELMGAEHKFHIKNEQPKYEILGYIDKMAIKNDIIKIWDYKTSKSKPNQKEQKFNIQALMYNLAALKLYPNVKKVFVNFLFLRFKKQPLLVSSYSNENLRGFEQYLNYLDTYISEWSYEKAIANFGYDDCSKKRLCGSVGTKDDGSKKWICIYQLPRKYFALKNEKGDILKTSETKEELSAKNGEIIEELNYLGCPRFNPRNY